MRTIFVVTHPESTHHVERKVGGWFDSQLTSEGLRAADSIARTLRTAIPPDANVQVCSSDLHRTVQTAVPICAVLGGTPALDSRFREKSYGRAEGKPQSWLDARFVPPPAFGTRLAHDEGIEGAETMETFARRVYSAVDDVLRQNYDYQVIVTHGGVLTFVLAAWGGIPIESLGYLRVQPRPGSITELHEDDYFHNRQIVRLSDTGHLTN